MIRGLIILTAFTVALPALAQGVAQPAQNNAAQPGAATSGDAVASIVESEFSAYDQNGDGQLDKAEFARWMVALKDQEMKATGKTLPPAEVTAWADGAFVTADTDRSATVSKPELIAYLSAGVS